MLAATTPTKVHNSPYQSAMSPSHPHRRTPYRRPSVSAFSFDNPMLTPSPLRKPSMFSPKWSANVENGDDLFLQSPYKSPAQAHNLFRTPAYSTKPLPIPADDEEGRIFLSSNSTATFTPLFPSTSSKPLTTPVKSSHQPQSRRPALTERNLNRPLPMMAPTSDDTFSTRTNTGVKRKSTPLFTPLKIETSGSFQKLAPLPALQLSQRTPASGADAEAYVSKHTARLRLNDRLNLSVAVGDDSDEELESPGPKPVFKSDRTEYLKGKAKAEVAEAISPGGHVTKRRARTRPLSAELLGQQPFESPSPVKKSALNRPRHSGPVVFPSSNAYRSRASPASSSSEAGSPAPRRKLGNAARPYIKPPVFAARPPMSRHDNLSAATLFFGPTIPQSPPVRNRTSTDSPVPDFKPIRPKATNRHSYAGTSTSGDWAHISTERITTSPPVDTSGYISTDVEDEDMDFEGPAHSSFTFSLSGGTPSPTIRRPLPLKFESVKDKTNLLSVMPGASSSSSSLCSDDGLITPLTHASSASGWPVPEVHDRDSEENRARFTDDETEVDEFIVRALEAGGKAPGPSGKKPPGTPVKKARIAFLGADRPWQSAFSSKIGFNEEEPKKKAPRKSMPAAFPPMGTSGKSLLDQCSDTEDEEDSPSAKKDGKYTKLGLGHPSALFSAPFANPKTRWLMRRSSSGAFSSGSETASQANTPTRTKNMDWQLPKLTLSPSGAQSKLAGRSASGSSTSSGSTSSPTNRKDGSEAGTGQRRRQVSLINRRLSEPFAAGQTGRFERDFETVDEVGSGEFGSVIKVRSKNGGDNRLYAIKRSKRFEGVKHRLRLWEEVEVLKHLSFAAERCNLNGGHPNVLAHIDSWEEDEVLFIQTELCESGNLARFLWEYGKVFPRLDEARVWKIVADLIDGLSFIHDSGVIHLDLKPSNVFVTHEGRFKIGDFGMASLWPRQPVIRDDDGEAPSFEREGDKLYLAPEVLQGVYSSAADVFSFGMTILETATNIVVPDQGDSWHRLRREDLSEVKWEGSNELLELIKQTMRTDPAQRVSAQDVYNHPVVTRARRRMQVAYERAKADGTTVFAASPLAGVNVGFLEEILGDENAMDVS
ncbi:other/WEE protein kinase [Coprinopsis sp. MPI-PUGE-AT-0042]|nr:other/WEE protein kinase [Coprinopsis sp. MPI-PUGE-AT-0042]